MGLQAVLWVKSGDQIFKCHQIESQKGLSWLLNMILVIMDK